MFRYSSMQATLADAVAKLAATLRAIEGPVHVVAHSLGGLVALEAFVKERDLPPGRAVLLASPVQGSRAAQAVAAWSFGPQVLGGLALAEIARPCRRRWSGSREIGVIAGARPAGLGRLFASLPQPNDGTVCLEETELPGATARAVFDVSHTGMLFSRDVAHATASFLRDGRFPQRDS